MEKTESNLFKGFYQGFAVLKFKRGGIVVYDPSIQPVDSPNVYLFGTQSKKLISYMKDTARISLVRVNDKREQLLALAHYTEWKALNGHRIESAVEVDPFIDLQPDPNNKRTARCWNCKRDLDSQADSICPRCGWIRCSCGACGCHLLNNNDFDEV